MEKDISTRQLRERDQNDRKQWHLGCESIIIYCYQKQRFYGGRKRICTFRVETINLEWSYESVFRVARKQKNSLLYIQLRLECNKLSNFGLRNYSFLQFNVCRFQEKNLLPSDVGKNLVYKLYYVAKLRARLGPISFMQNEYKNFMIDAYNTVNSSFAVLYFQFQTHKLYSTLQVLYVFVYNLFKLFPKRFVIRKKNCSAARLKELHFARYNTFILKGQYFAVSDLSVCQIFYY